ncbi:hypothetical protein PIB30_074172 [Stylosanthes scabra]|uniref:CCHC-type domain-containing protein n=1 Tax=Stylosanthes scabra TaxID=79078 RepID=A0ABU6ZN87_9FABA|nr:hypothetical protein [Stylosanthes scabra]
MEENFNLVAKVISDRELTCRTIKAALMGIWGHPKGVMITDVGMNKVLISFQDRSKGIQMWKGGPWNIRGYLVNMQQWSGNQSMLEIRHQRMELWLHLHRVPYNCRNWRTAIAVGKRFGLVTDMEDPWKDKNLQRSFLRVKIERIQDCYCYNCDKLGHAKKDCSHPTTMSLKNTQSPKYKPGLGVNREKPLISHNEEDMQ